MSESEKFTIDDAENDGLIKREAGKTAASQAQQHAIELWDMFTNVCEEQGRKPEEVLGDHVLRAIRSESHSRRLSETTIDLSQINNDQLSIEDAKFIQQMMDSLGLNTEQEKDPLTKYMERRMESATQGPIGRIRNRGQKDVDADVQKELDEIKAQINALAQEQDHQEQQEQDTQDKADLDDLVDSATSADTEADDGGGEPDVDVEVEEADEEQTSRTDDIQVQSVDERGGMSARPTEFPTSEDATDDE